MVQESGVLGRPPRSWKGAGWDMWGGGRDLFLEHSRGSAQPWATPRGLTAPLPTGAPGPERPRTETPTYVNVPASPSSQKQQHYLGLRLPEASAVIRGGCAVAGPGPGRLITPSFLAVKLGLWPWGDGSCPLPPCPGGRGARRLTPLLAGAGASCYAQIDVTATEAAHRAGAQHALTREERLPALEQRRKGAPR